MVDGGREKEKGSERGKRRKENERKGVRGEGYKGTEEEKKRRV